MKPPPIPFLDLTTMKKAKRILVAVVGMTVLVLGIALVVLPGPAFLAIPAGLAILAVEFAWARRWLRNARDFWRRMNPLASKGYFMMLIRGRFTPQRRANPGHSVARAVNHDESTAMTCWTNNLAAPRHERRRPNRWWAGVTARNHTHQQGKKQ